ncbi:flagellar biosynthesis protein FlhA [Desulfitibacter alkalitolerans]|uniref:flagellar biosynthesis protein FlhA n=1 Tax=Desulfitibacter alkalitolerans TaxID=264641 RepID=UPI00055930DF|nr:flagellar biosynthesis protein FlhA [Desulfitibacter alkalitolerans]
MPQNQSAFTQRLRKVLGYTDIIIAALIISIVLIIVIPVHPSVLDVLLTLSLAIGVIVILTTMFITRPLQFSVFPSLLLVVTLFRLALNISSTRLILGEGSAGQVIAAFGNFVVGGNYVVGFIVFVIITVIQFVVITNGASRVAEVAARFTLDAMPGKQMSIDADLNAGIVTEQEAKERRETIQKEADFFGAMDGSSKFVKGDAIAGIIIVIVNILGGLIIGVWQRGLDVTQAMQVYTLLTVGDGLVTQVPALLVSTATGILVTRAATGQSLGKDISQQLFAFPKVIGLAAVILAILGILPGLPPVPFLILAAATGFTAYLLHNDEKRKQLDIDEQELQRSTRETKEPENVLSLMQVDTLEIEIGYNLIPLTDEGQQGDLLDRLSAVRRQCARELGIYVKPIRIRDNLQLEANSYRFKIRGNEIASGQILPGYYLAMSPGDESMEVNGIATTEPTFGLPAWWVNEEVKEQVEMQGFTVVDSATVLITHLTEFIKSHAHELLGRQEVKELIELVQETNPAAIEGLVPDALSLGEVQKVLQNLLAERIPIRDMVTIFETLANRSAVSKDLDYLTESIRAVLARTISKTYAPEGKLIVVTIELALEERVKKSIQQTADGVYPALSPEVTEHIYLQLEKYVEDFALLGLQPVVLCSSRIRMALRRLTERFMPGLVVLSLNELIPELDVEAIGMVKDYEN